MRLCFQGNQFGSLAVLLIGHKSRNLQIKGSLLNYTQLYLNMDVFDGKNNIQTNAIIIVKRLNCQGAISWMIFKE